MDEATSDSLNNTNRGMSINSLLNTDPAPAPAGAGASAPLAAPAPAAGDAPAGDASSQSNPLNTQDQMGNMTGVKCIAEKV